MGVTFHVGGRESPMPIGEDQETVVPVIETAGSERDQPGFKPQLWHFPVGI